MGIHQLDSFGPPTDATLDQAKAAGVHSWPGYIGGPEAAITWPASGFERIRAKGLRSPGIYVGLGSGPEAVALAQQRGIPKGEVIWHDVETQWSMTHDTVPMAQAWVSAVKTAGYQAGLYGTAAFVSQYGSHYDVVWAAGGAYYRNGPGGNPWPTTPMQVPGCTPPSRPSGVQWWATHDEFGIGVDRSIMDDHFGITPTGDEMPDKQTADYLAWTQFFLGLGRMPEDMEAVGYRGDRIMQVGTLSSFWELTGSKEGKSGGGIFGWMGAVNTHLAGIDAHLADLDAWRKSGGSGPAPTFDTTALKAEADKIRAEMAALHDAFAKAAEAAAS
jgi:hypothetical protein